MQVSIPESKATPRTNMKRGFLKGKSLNTGNEPIIKVQTRITPPPAPNAKTVDGFIPMPCGPASTSRDAPLVGTLPPDMSHRIAVTLPPRELCGTERMTTTLLFPGMKEAILALPGFPAPLTHTAESFEIGPIKGKGLGMFATADFDTGDLIICERPLYVSTVVQPFSLRPGDPTANDAIVELLSRMCEYDRRMFYSLHNCKGNDCPREQGIIDTNAINVGALPGYDGACAAIYIDVSRINHSCTPNVISRWDLLAFTMEIRALTPIRKGEEITMSYMDKTAPRADRQKELKEKYDFICRCPSCSLTGAAAKESHIRLATIYRSAVTPYDDDELEKWINDVSAPEDKITKACLFVLDMMEKEKYFNEKVWAVRSQRLCKAYCAMEKLEEAKKCAIQAAKIWKALAGNDGGWLAVAEAPQKTKYWGLRTKKIREAERANAQEA
ncbi:SET domain-containing protein [Laetiporus sulphureus 93-53]|uniref:SET domain-containing protein n=1 Tax=Laetiporus sulphureus 93-53 TaxID=1314785 RepID=A0A165C0M9_9APHY|nr:SET domain-containing protein [Laetiporus sulphureus 93-53]KZT01986.1 SET domain-containing protein [Laetiporus sulphureus 93-53]